MRLLARTPVDDMGLLITTLDIDFHRSVGDLNTYWYLAALQQNSAIPPPTHGEALC